MESFAYNHLNTFLKTKFGERVLKVAVDGGFSCPNRDGVCGVGGCIFCGEERKNDSSICEQVLRHLASYRGKRANKFILYFQNFSNTYAPVNELKAKYDAGLGASDKFVALAIATRPDCITDEIADLLALYKERYYVWVEFGLQTSNESTAKLINRGYDNAIFEKAVDILRKRGIDVVVHIMVGLPSESENDYLNTISYLNGFDIAGIKIHSTYVLRGTALCTLYENGKYKPLELDEYIEAVINILTHSSPRFVVHRISGDAPKDKLVAPLWNTHKKLVLNGVENKMKARGLFQGMLFDAKD